MGEDLDLLRSAEAGLRKHGTVQDIILADWIRVSAMDLWAHGPLCECGSVCDECDDSLWERHTRQALIYAKFYLDSLHAEG